MNELAGRVKILQWHFLSPVWKELGVCTSSVAALQYSGKHDANAWGKRLSRLEVNMSARSEGDHAKLDNKLLSIQMAFIC